MGLGQSSRNSAGTQGHPLLRLSEISIQITQDNRKGSQCHLRPGLLSKPLPISFLHTIQPTPPIWIVIKPKHGWCSTSGVLRMSRNTETLSYHPEMGRFFCVPRTNGLQNGDFLIHRVFFPTLAEFCSLKTRLKALCYTESFFKFNLQRTVV